MQTLPMVVLAAAVAFAHVAAAASPLSQIENEQDQAIAEAFLKHVKNTPSQVARLAEGTHPEDHCWQTFKHIGLTLTAYRLTEDPRYLDVFVKNMDIMQAALSKGPDGFLGWYGKAYKLFQPANKPDLKVDVIITSFQAVELLCRFIRTIDADPALAERYAAKRAEYLDLMTDHLVKKWDVRGNYVDLGKRGAVYRTHGELKPEKGHLTQPHNKHTIIGGALLSLYKLTGNDEYLKKAVKLGLRFKHCLKLKDGHYEWNYWDPAGAWDVHPKDPNKWKHWIGVEHKGGYYASSLSQAVRLHAEGLVFDKTDIDRFVKTQTEMCWNGDVDNPQWSRCDGTRKAKYTNGAYMCGALATYSEKIAAYCGRSDPEGRKRQRAERYAKRDHGWQGGIVAEGYVNSLVHEVRKAAGGNGKPAAEPLGAGFLAKAENRAWLEALDFAVEPPGYAAPRTPAEIPDMPAEPGN
ncbi:MAG: hypothetical protein JXR37_33680 [Kiritimatiellae bacterium]|nr:hypothetical protein [Kiritimatiellia bacterium]